MNKPRHRDHRRVFGPSMMIAFWPEDEWCPGSAPRTVRDDAPVRDDDGIGVFRVLVPALLVSVFIWLVLLKVLTWVAGMFAAALG